MKKIYTYIKRICAFLLVFSLLSIMCKQDIFATEISAADVIAFRGEEELSQDEIEEITDPVSEMSIHDIASSENGLAQFIEEDYSDVDLVLPEEEISVYSIADAGYWEKFESPYFKSKMNSAWVGLYDRLYTVCMRWLTTDETISFKKASDWVFIEDFPYEPGKTEQLKQCFLLFANSNPQFYFLGLNIVYAKVNGKYAMRPSIYDNGVDEYADGSVRLSSTEKVRQYVDYWLDQIPNEFTEAQKVEKIYQILASNIAYDNGKNDYYHQSIATAVLTGTTVCAGYAELFLMLCRGVGISCIAVTSFIHEWNQVYIEGKWYNVDITWDDLGDKADTIYFLKGDKDFQKNYGHIPEEFYKDIRPICEKNYDLPTPLNLSRFSRPDGQDWLMSSNPEEISLLLDAGWQNEGNVGSTGIGGNVIRFYNVYSGDRMYSANAKEIQNYRDAKSDGWIDEGVAFRQGSNVQVIRYITPFQTHLWSTSKEEQQILDAAEKYGWKREGVAFYL